MSIEHEFNFGWRQSSPEKKDLHARLYAWSVYIPIVAANVEVDLATDPRFVQWYDQDGMNACVGASCSKLMATINLPQIGAQQYSWRELYRRACEIDNDPQTSYAKDVGTYLWAGGDTLRRFGAYVNGAFNPEHGLGSYFWAHTVDDCRTALSLGRPLEFGLPWYEGWMPSKLEKKDGEWWIPARSKWGRPVGGHAICAVSISDKLAAVGLYNTWGTSYPEIVWFPYDDIAYLLSQGGGECFVPVDLPWQPPAPEPEPQYWTVRAGEFAYVGDSPISEEQGIHANLDSFRMERIK